MRIALALTIALLLTACAGVDDAQHGLVLVGSEVHRGATVLLDGRPIAQMQPPNYGGSAVQWLMKKVVGESPMNRIVTGHIDLTTTRLARGTHVLRVEKAGLPAAEGSFTYPFTSVEPGEFPSFSVDGTKICEWK
jgi:hypothetical protein